MGLENFTIPGVADRPSYHCTFDTLMTGISLRHSDTVDVRFLVNGRPVVIALAHAGLARFSEAAGRIVSDAEAIQMAGLFLKRLLEQGEQMEGSTLPVNVEETLALARQVRPQQARPTDR